MVSVGVSKLGCTHLIFVDPGVKINGCYYREVLLSQQLLPPIWQVSGDFLVFQQDSASVHTARETIKLLQWETLAFISPDLLLWISPGELSNLSGIRPSCPT